MIKPFKILHTEPRDGGLGVNYSVDRSFKDSKGIVTETLESYLLVPLNEDVDAYVYNYLKQFGWVD